ASGAGATLTALAEIDGVRLLTSLAFEGFGPAIVPATAVPRWLKGDFHRLQVPELPQRTVGWASYRRQPLAAPARAVHSLLVGMADFVVMTDAAYAFVSGPSMVAEFTGVVVGNDELGGPGAHMRQSGLAAMLAPDRAGALEHVSALLSYLPDNCDTEPPLRP